MALDYRNFKLIALDLDGTTLTSAKTITEATVAAIARARSLGMKVVLTTGRAPKSIVRYAKALNILDENAYAACFNGSCIVSLHDISVDLAHQGLKVQTAVDLLRYAQNYPIAGAHAYVYSGKLLILNHCQYSEKEIFNSLVDYAESDFVHMDENDLIYKMIVVGDAAALDDVRAHVPDSMLSDFTMARTDPHYLEFMPHGCSKGQGVVTLGRMLGIEPQEMIAFGDAENDLEMIKRVGAGVAMANAQQLVRDNADYITLSNNEDGVADFLNRLFAGQID